ncbi:phosphomannomutase [Balneicella halophila]|uniref:Phosphomannomutase n=1 Tax=Balneicella halophila TaxID=1537566 RepID=A0A7L4UPC9_BALHA|nr:phosphoglucosamine mutase [Balneicella halophila]PVX50981.1 phosphomannomutase [Balneicella halophila]
MTLIKSISGIRGTIGGKVSEGLTPIDVVKFTAAYGQWLKNTQGQSCKVVVGRDARISGKMVEGLVCNTLLGMGIDVIHLGLATTPTTELMVTAFDANGGLILTASHNPKQWNALKMLNEKGEFLTAAEGESILKLADSNQINFVDVDDLGEIKTVEDALERHIEHVKNLKLVDVQAIKEAKFKVVVDAVNSVGGLAIPKLLKELGVEVVELYCEPNGEFPHNPEPLPENLTEISTLVKEEQAHLGIVVDPDVDRLAFVCEDGTMFGEEYTLVAVADYVLQHTPGNTVSNLSSTMALRDVTEKHNGTYTAAAVGEVNVVSQMKATNAIIGGEGNGGVIYPESHYGRDALVGVGLFLSHLAHSKMSCTELLKTYPAYYISKNKIELTPETNVDAILDALKEKYKEEEINTIDGVKIIFGKEWVHLRKSNTEPIIRIYSESSTSEKAEALAEQIKQDVNNL